MILDQNRQFPAGAAEFPCQLDNGHVFLFKREEQTQMNHETLTGFLRRKQINISVQTYLIDALGAMAFGLFASLLIGTIFGTLGEKTGIEIFNTIAVYAKGATGAALGVSISYALKSPQLVIFSAATVGIAGNELGGPVGALAATIIASELGKLVSKETRVDILVTPGVTIISGVLTAQLVGPGVSAFMTGFGDLVKTATVMQPLFMGILVSALIGIALTLPISSAAICIMLSLDGLAGGAAPAGRARPVPGRTGRRRRHSRLLRPDDRFRRTQLPRKRFRRPLGPGTWHFHAPDAEHCQKSENLAGSHSGFHGDGTCLHYGV